MGTNIKQQSFPLQGGLLPELSWSRICILFHTTHQAATEKCSSISLYILSGKSSLFLHSNKLNFATGGYELSWKSPGFRYQWCLGNSVSIRLHSRSAVTETKITAPCSIQSMHKCTGLPHPLQISGEKCKSQRCYMWCAQWHPPAKTKTFKSELFQFMLPNVLLCKNTHKKDRFLSITPFFPCFHFGLPFATIWCSWWRETAAKHVEDGGHNLALAIKICQVLRQKLHAVSLIF